MKSLSALSVVAVLLAGCEGHQYEPREPGLSVSGEAKAGVKYTEGQGSSLAKDVTLKLSLGGGA